MLSLQSKPGPLKLKSDLISLNYFYGVKGQTSEEQQRVGHNSELYKFPRAQPVSTYSWKSCIAFGAEAQKVSISLGKFTFSLYYSLFMPKLKKRAIIVLSLLSARTEYLHDIF